MPVRAEYEALMRAWEKMESARWVICCRERLTLRGRAGQSRAGRAEGGTVGNGGHVAGKTGGNYPDAVPAESHTQTDRRRTRLFGGDGKDA